MGRACVGFLLAAAALASPACSRPRFTKPLALAGGKSVAVQVLNDGYEAYTHYCYACHGTQGDGRGPSSPGMRPPPRDFTEGLFKFAGVAAGQLPQDDDLGALIEHGLGGTPMLAWDIGPQERHAIVQYIKTFSERWKTEEPGQRIQPDAQDPWTGREAEALALGQTIYHLMGAEMPAGATEPKHIFANCNSCHPSYLSRAEIGKLHGTVPGLPQLDFRPDMFRPVAKETQYKVANRMLSLLPTDFLFHTVKNGTSVAALYRTIAAGIGGTAMPSWKAAIKDPDLWALSRYVKSLVDMRGSPEAVALQARLQAAGN